MTDSETATVADVEMQQSTGSGAQSTAADSIKTGLAVDSEQPTTFGEPAPRKNSQVKNLDEQSVSIFGKVEKSESDEAEPEKPLKGLQNQGATCYMNSLLQALYMTPDFRQMIYKFE